MSPRHQHLYEFGPYRLDTAEQQLLRDGEPVPLTPRVFDTLVALIERRGHLVGKDELMKAVWSEAFVEESNLTNNVYTLRKLLGQGENGRSYIETVPKRGYRFTAPVKELSADALVLEKRTVTRIVTEERDDDVPSTSIATVATSAPRLSPALLAAGVVLIGAVAVYSGYRLIAPRPRVEKPASSVPFGTMDMARVTTSGNITHAAISADGKYVAHVVKDASGNSLWVKHVDAPSNVRVAGPAVTEYISVAFLPGLNSVYYIALDHDKGESTLYRVPVFGGPSDIVANDIYPIGLSPDGKQMAFVRMQRSASTLVVANVDGSNQRVVATRQKPDFFELEWIAPAWSPDGKTLACAVSLNDQRGQYETIIGVNLADGTQAPLSGRRWGYVGQAVWLPDGSGLLVSASEGSGSPMQVWHVRLQGGAATQVTHDLNNYRDLSLTRDASRLAAVQVEAISSIWVAARGDTRSAREIRSEIGTLETFAWTHDGQLVYHSSAGGKGADIWIMNADGTDAKQLTVGARVAHGLAATPDGRHIIFSSDATDRFHLWRVDTDGGNLRQLTDGNGEFFPHCTPDGRWVVYQSESIDPRVWKVPTEGGRPVQLTTTRAAKPAVSPDGRMIAYSYLDVDLNPSRWGIGIISSEGGQRLKRFDFSPTVRYRYVRWSPDGQSIAFLNSPGGHSDIWLQPLDGRPPKQLTDFRAEQILAFDWSPDGRSLAFVRNVETSDAVHIQSK
jgi:Tol biopolymer transport system component/DNA-binding winged helix-turn-helix (wHTH) protein